MTLRGWKEITDYTKLSDRTIKELRVRKENPFPLVFISRKPYLSKTLFEEWIKSETIAQKKAVNS
jgi:hypothetical protein